MLLVRREEVGRAAYVRLVADGTIVPFAVAVGRPADVPDSPGLRAHLVSQHVADDVLVTGLTALWVRGFGSVAPALWHVVGPRHARSPRAPWITRHVGSPDGNATVVARVWVASMSRACLDALRWEGDRAEQTVATVLGDLRHAAATLRLAVLAEDARAPHHATVVARVTRLTRSAQPARLAPVTRRAS